MRILKILYVGLKYNYGDPKKGYDATYENMYLSLIKMHEGKHDIIPFFVDVIFREVGRDEMNEQLLKAVYSNNPDLVFSVIGDDVIKKETIKEITDFQDRMRPKVVVLDEKELSKKNDEEVEKQIIDIVKKRAKEIGEKYEED